MLYVIQIHSLFLPFEMCLAKQICEFVNGGCEGVKSKLTKMLIYVMISRTEDFSLFVMMHPQKCCDRTYAPNHFIGDFINQ